MREIRFRYYDQFNGCFGWSRNFKNLAEFFSNYQMAVDGENNPILEQSTGLEDSKGVEIFEGGTLSFTVFDCFDNDTQYIGVVRYEGSRFMIFNPKWDDGNYGSNGPFDLDWVVMQDDEIEIIGNIHENPKLLEGK